MRVAIAGGTSPTLGTSIVSALLATQGRYTPVILSRKKRDVSRPSAQQSCEIRYVDYSSQPSLVAALRDVEVVISVLLIPGPDWVTAQVNLLHAAEEAGCRRFAPSEFSLTEHAHTMVDLLAAKNVVWKEVQTSIRQGKIDAARFPCGMFMNYLGIGIPEEEIRLEALAGFQEGSFLIHLDAPSPWIEVPVHADGSFPSLSMTDIRDVGSFVVAALDIEEPWGGRDLGMAGDTLSFADLISLCEQYTGKSIEVRKVTKAELITRLRGIPPSQFIQYMECQLEIVGTLDQWVIDPALNRLSSVQPTTVEQYMRQYWGRK
ncbi:uncharacterized protein N7484_005422 [Penicillium longicatenatum]|uniref:uncharacterized protein n=1 Tax=Penicillium longicatenatum TaxID=1561947 RepID=UPI00254739DC|nr:uncharacterized protein N7484_005422 [Penicillium longicatenatum]KAJ5642915.1 hypothetical protein N7484_005422 [Penicillium longicatenatum]